ncbi:hypothetical protein ACIA2T_04690 [Amycolatopsis japonica]|uniref:hypothetical protein n=1 Tax=Amycolatopsis japonica TaxID=208439 RepID=UPI0037AC317D
MPRRHSRCADQARIIRVFGKKVDEVKQDAGYPTGWMFAPHPVIFVLAVLLAASVAASWGPNANTLTIITKSVLGTISFALLAFQGFTAIFAWRLVTLYGHKKIPRNPDDGIGKAVHYEVTPDYVRRLLKDGYDRFHRMKLDRVIDLLLEPHRFNLRITEEIVPEQPVARCTVTKDIRLGKVDTNTSLLVPIADFPKGVLLDGLEVTVDSKPATILSYDESLRVSAALLLTARTAEYLDALDTTAPDKVRLKKKTKRTVINRFRDQISSDMYEIARPASSLTNKEKSVAELDLPSSNGTPQPSRAEWLISRLRANYVLFAVVEKPQPSLKVTYSRFTSLHGKDAVNSRSGRHLNRVAEIRFRLGQFPVRITYTTPLIYKCESYHLRVVLPSGLYVHTHELHERVSSTSLEPRQQQYFKALAGRTESDNGDPPTYMRARDHRALPYAHFYARNGYQMKRVLHTHVLNVFESPLVTLRLAATLLFLASLGIVIAGVTLVDQSGNYSLKSGVIAVAVSAPGVLASWSRQVFGIEALQRSSLMTQIALRATTTFSLVGLALAVLADAGAIRWHVKLHLFSPDGPVVPVYDGYWIVLICLSIAASTLVWCRYHKRRMQYLALSRRSLTSVHNRSMEEVA